MLFWVVILCRVFSHSKTLKTVKKTYNPKNLKHFSKTYVSCSLKTGGRRSAFSSRLCVGRGVLRIPDDCTISAIVSALVVIPRRSGRLPRRSFCRRCGFLSHVDTGCSVLRLLDDHVLEPDLRQVVVRLHVVAC